MQYHTINLSELQSLATFETTAEMDEVIYSYIDVLRANHEPESVIDTLLFLGRSSLRVTGVSFAKYETIGNAIGKSKRTVIRCMNVLESYGMIEKIPTTRLWNRRGGGKSRKKSVNIIRILPNSPQYDTIETAEEVPTGKETEDENCSEPLSDNHPLNTKVFKSYSRTPSMTPYKTFRQAVQTFIGEDSQPTVSRLYGVYLANTKPLRLTEYYSTEGQGELISAAIQAIQETFKATKRKRIRNLAGYFNGVLSNKLDELSTLAHGI